MSNFRQSKKMRGFSLIELLVVITIIGILAAVSIPTYQSYSIRTKLSVIVPHIYEYLNKQKVFWATHNRFASPSEIASIYGTTASGNNFNGSISPYLNSVYTYTGGANGCTGNIEVVSFGLNLTAMGIPSNFATTGQVDCYAYNLNGAIRNYCGYYLWDAASNYILGDYIPIWYGCKEPTCSNPRPYYQMKDGYGNNPGFSWANC